MEGLPQDLLSGQCDSGEPKNFSAVVVGGSAGGIQAVSRLVADLPPDFPLPVVVVLHQHPDSNNCWHDLLRTRTSLPVLEALDKMPLTAGTIHCAPANYHLLLESDFSLALSVDEKINFARPSIDLLFSSAAEVFGPALIGVILTGANNDGAGGLADIAAGGGITIVQSPTSAEWPIMPSAALKAVPGALSIDLERIAAVLCELIRPGGK
jgi:two-component system chemotaxis response regulator CheB